jgi:hypothetical protein
VSAHTSCCEREALSVALLPREEIDGVQAPEVYPRPVRFQVGDRVRVNAGPFRGSTGVATQVGAVRVSTALGDHYLAGPLFPHGVWSEQVELVEPAARFYLTLQGCLYNSGGSDCWSIFDRDRMMISGAGSRREVAERTIDALLFGRESVESFHWEEVGHYAG